MYQGKVYVDFDSPGVLHEATRGFDEPFDVLEATVHRDGTITFVVDTRGHRDTFAGRIKDAPKVAEIDRLDGERLRIRKEARGATVAIRENRGKLNGIDKIHGTKRIFEVLLLWRADIQSMIADLREFGRVRIESLVEVTSPPSVLSDRQYEAVQAALEMGYFEWPRETDIEAVADALGVAHPTALEHLRKAQQKLLRQALNTVTARTTRRDRQFLLDSQTI
ncbi:MAG: helix-turn-helix domain-containing protein [Salinirussus sp.]